MPTFETWDIVKVPFPYTDRPVRQRRPALVVARESTDAPSGLLWVLMITSAENRGWFGDVAISDLAQSGLPAASIVRTAKIATIESADAEHLGVLLPLDCSKVAANLRGLLAQALNTP